jgi:hypothetical protein
MTIHNESFGSIIFFGLDFMIHTLLCLVEVFIMKFHAIEDCQRDCSNEKETGNNS